MALARRLIIATPRWVWLWTALFLAAGALPFVVGWLNPPEGKAFTGVAVNEYDTNSYLANMQIGYEGGWLYRLPYTPQRNQPVPLFLFYIALGHIARLGGLPLPFTFHAARLLCGGIFALAAYHFMARVLDRNERRRALFLLLFTGGTGWLIFLLLGTDRTAAHPELIPDQWLIDAGSFLAMLSNGHFTLNMALMMALLVAGEHFIAQGRPRAALAGIAAGVAIAFVHAHQIAVIGLVLAAQVALESWPPRRLDRGRVVRLALLFAPVALVAAALTLTTRSDPYLASWLEQGNTFTPPPWGLASLYGPLWVLALARLPAALRDSNPAWRAIALWFLVVLALIYVPVNFQRRFMEGWHIPVILLATAGWTRAIAPALQRRFSVQMVRQLDRLIIASVLLGTLWLSSGVLARMIWIDNPFFFASADEQAAVTALRQHADLDDVVLAAFENGNRLPARVPVRSFAGHWSLTAFVRDRFADIERFFDASTPDDERRALLADFGIDFVYYGPDERELGAFDPANVPYLERIFASPTVQLYRAVTPSAN